MLPSQAHAAGKDFALLQPPQFGGDGCSQLKAREALGAPCCRVNGRPCARAGFCSSPGRRCTSAAEGERFKSVTNVVSLPARRGELTPPPRLARGCESGLRELVPG